MAIQTLHDTGSSYDIPSKFDGGVYQVATIDCVIGNVGDEFTLQYNANSLTISFAMGSEAVIGGSFFKLTSTESVTLEANTTIYLCANIDLSRPNGETGKFAQRTASNMQSDNLNGTSPTPSRDLLLYIITTGASGITSVEDKRVIKNEAIKELPYGIDSSRKVADFRFGTNSDTNIHGGSWVATEDCFAFLHAGNYGHIKIDNVILASGDNPTPFNTMWTPIRKGTTIEVKGISYSYIWAWGLKGNS